MSSLGYQPSPSRHASGLPRRADVLAPVLAQSEEVSDLTPAGSSAKL